MNSVTSAEWQDFVTNRSKELSDPAVTEALLRFQLVPGGPQNETADACIHRGDLTIDGDFVPSSWITVIDGNLHVSGKVSTCIEGGDGHVTLVVFGDLKCGSIDNDWASIIFVTGDAIVRDWVFASREDSSMVVGGDFRTPILSVPISGYLSAARSRWNMDTGMQSLSRGLLMPMAHPRYSRHMVGASWS